MGKGGGQGWVTRTLTSQKVPPLLTLPQTPPNRDFPRLPSPQMWEIFGFLHLLCRILPPVAPKKGMQSIYSSVHKGLLGRLGLCLKSYLFKKNLLFSRFSRTLPPPYEQNLTLTLPSPKPTPLLTGEKLTPLLLVGCVPMCGCRILPWCRGWVGHMESCEAAHVCS